MIFCHSLFRRPFQTSFRFLQSNPLLKINQWAKQFFHTVWNRPEQNFMGVCVCAGAVTASILGVSYGIKKLYEKIYPS